MEERSACDSCEWCRKDSESFRLYCDKGHEIDAIACPDFVELEPFAPPEGWAKPSGKHIAVDEIPF
jgi:hypothetical protein